jgi:hypothetical protein
MKLADVSQTILGGAPVGQRYAARIDFTSRATAEADFARTNALRDANEADLAGVRLRMAD